MSYSVAIEERAQQDIRRLPPRVGHYCLTQLASLQHDAVLLSQPARLPFRPNCQLFTFDFDYEGDTYLIDVLFQYGADEQTLYIQEISWSFPLDADTET